MAADPRPRETCGAFRRALQNYRHHALELHQLDLRRVFVLTQYKALSLNRHIRAGWSPLMGLGEYIEVLPPQMRVSNQWYQGTADAVYQNIYSIGSERSKYVFILSGDHIYKMNYSRMLQQHVDSGAEVTVGVIEIPVRRRHGSLE